MTRAFKEITFNQLKFYKIVCNKLHIHFNKIVIRQTTVSKVSLFFPFWILRLISLVIRNVSIELYLCKSTIV